MISEADKRALMAAAAAGGAGSASYSEPRASADLSSMGGVEPPRRLDNDAVNIDLSSAGTIGELSKSAAMARFGSGWDGVSGGASRHNPGSSQWLEEARGTDQFGGRQQFALENNFHGSDNAGAVSSNASGVPNGVPGQGTSAPTGFGRGDPGITGAIDGRTGQPGAAALGGPTAAQVSASLDMDAAQFGTTPSAPSMASNTTGRSMGMPGQPAQTASFSTGVTPNAPATAMAAAPATGVVGTGFQTSRGVPGSVAAPMAATSFAPTQTVERSTPVAVATAPVSAPTPPARPSMEAPVTAPVGLPQTMATPPSRPGIVNAPAPVQAVQPGVVTAPSMSLSALGETSDVGALMASQVMDALGLTPGVQGVYGPGAFGLGGWGMGGDMGGDYGGGGGHGGAAGGGGAAGNNGGVGGDPGSGNSGAQGNGGGGY